MSPVNVDDIIDSFGFGRAQMLIILGIGIIQALDAMEIVLLAVLGPALQCTWRITSSQVAFLTTSVFAGMLIGAPFFGLLSDKFGRKAILFISAINVGYFGLLGAMSHNYIAFVSLRAICGFFIGGVMASTSSLTSETMPRTYRAAGITVTLSFWTIGSLFECLLAYLIMESLGWRWLTVFTTIPLVCGLIILPFIPESPRFLLLSGQKAKALQVLRDLAPKGSEEIIHLKPIEHTNLGNAFEMFHKNYRLTTLLIFVQWFACGFTYFGLILVTSILPSHPHECLQDTKRFSTALNNGDVSCCEELSNKAYITMILSSFSDFVSAFISIFCSEIFGRKMSLIFLSFTMAVFSPLLGLCVNILTLNILLITCRIIISTYFYIVIVYTVEVFPTSIRSLSMGFCGAISRVGAMLTPFIAQVMLKEYSTLGALFMYSGISLVAAIAAIFLPIETKSRALYEKVQ